MAKSAEKTDAVAAEAAPVATSNATDEGAQTAPQQAGEEHRAGTAGEPAAARRVYARLHNHAEKTELGNAQGGQGTADQRL